MSRYAEHSEVLQDLLNACKKAKGRKRMLKDKKRAMSIEGKAVRQGDH
jgi:hypothetical protein